MRKASRALRRHSRIPATSKVNNPVTLDTGGEHPDAAILAALADFQRLSNTTKAENDPAWEREQRAWNRAWRKVLFTDALTFDGLAAKAELFSSEPHLLTGDHIKAGKSLRRSIAAVRLTIAGAKP